MNFLKRYKIPIAGAGIVVLIVGFLLFRPDKLFIDDSVDESLSDAFPVAAAAATEEVTPPTTTTTTAAPAEESVTEDAVVAETTTTTAAPEPDRPVVLSSGGFYGIDHSAEGTANIYEQDGSFVLRFEDDTDIQNGPDLFVWLLADEDYAGGSPGEFIDLGKIKGNVGGQNYELPAEYDPDVHKSVLIWCKRFSVPFAAAPLA